MNIQSELQLENNLVKQLNGLGYATVAITNEADLLANLKTQLEKHNGIALKLQKLSDKEFAKVLNHLNKGNVFDKAKTLRDKFQLSRDDGTVAFIEFLNKDQWCQNQYQVTHQITQEGSYKNRYDVTLLVNGLPLAQIELKRRGLELKEAFNQINRYQRQSFWAGNGLFQYVQLFVISNGVNTKYYANNRRQSFKQTFYWADEQNNHITNLDEFAQAFLEKCHLSKMITKYIVLHESDKVLMALRPYQYYAVEAIVDKVQSGTNNGYIWHTTGSGKTLTSFKASQILVGLPNVDKVVFVVDRTDLDYQTAREFNHFSDGSVDSTDNTKALVDKLNDNTNLIVTTIQKLNTAISKKQHADSMEKIKDKRIVFIFDECHRSQFGETHHKINQFFSNPQMFGFTGTPIFEKNAFRNAFGKRTTKELFDTCLHKYVITNAIRDENVLRFSVEYWGKVKQKNDNISDEQVTGINTKEFFESPTRIDAITNWIIDNHNRKTHNRDFTAMFCVSSVDALIKYYEAFKAKKAAGQHNLRIATIFTYGTNEDDKDADGGIDEPDFDIENSINANSHSRAMLDSYIADYNDLYQTKFSTKDSQSFYNYYKDIAKRIKEKERDTFQDKDRLDVLLVVNMFLTGFDAKKLNTLYVDKNLKYHGLIQAYSRTNRILNELKSQGNIVSFRNLKENTDEALKLFSDLNASEVIFMEDYSVYVERFNKGVKDLKAIAPTVDSVNGLEDESADFLFVKTFRGLIRLLNILRSFSEFTFDDLDLTEQEFEDYKSKYLDIHDRRKREREEGASIIDDLDFELELIKRDQVNVTYILKLLAALHQESLKAKDKAGSQKRHQEIMSLIEGDIKLRSKKALIERFITQNLPLISDPEDIDEAFETFWTEEKSNALVALCEAEGLIPEKLQAIIETYLFNSREPKRQVIEDSLQNKTIGIIERVKIIDRVLEKIISFINIFEDHMS